MMRVCVKMPETINKPAVKEFTYPGPFFGQKAGGVFVANGVVDVYFRMADIYISADNQVGDLLPERLDIFIELVEKYIFKALPFISRSARRKVSAHHGKSFIVCPDHSSFLVYFRNATTRFYMQGFYPRKNRYPAVPFFWAECQ